MAKLVKYKDFKKFTSIESFDRLIRNNRKYNSLPSEMTFYSKIKLHGTNAGVRVYPDGMIVPQKRTGSINVNNDNAGFATWVESEDAFFKTLVRDDMFVIHGEWAGKGVQKGDAVCKIDKIFAVFAITVDDEYITDPNSIQHYLGFNRPANVHVLPIHSMVTITPYDIDVLTKTLDEITKGVDEIGKCDPWIKSVFDVEGYGEGLVFFPVIVPEDVKHTSLFFKVKTENHNGNARKDKKIIAIDPVFLEKSNEFVAMFCTERRYAQAIDSIECDYLSMREIGKFLKWVGQDINKESVLEVENMELEWRYLAPDVIAHAKTWFIKHIKIAGTL